MSGFVQGNNALVSSATTATISFLSNVAAGNLLVVVAKCGTAGLTITAKDNLGNLWTLYSSQGGGASVSTTAVFVASKVAGGAVTITLTSSSAGIWEIVCGEYDTFVTVNKQASGTAGITNNATSPSITPNSANQNNLIIGWCGNDTADGRVLTAGSGYTLRETANGNVGLQDKIVNSNAAITSTIVYSGGTVACQAGILAITDGPAGAYTVPAPTVSSPPLGYGDEKKFGSFGSVGRIDVPGGNASPGSNTSGAGQIFPTGFGTP